MKQPSATTWETTGETLNFLSIPLPSSSSDSYSSSDDSDDPAEVIADSSTPQKESLTADPGGTDMPQPASVVQQTSKDDPLTRSSQSMTRDRCTRYQMSRRTRCQMSKPIAWKMPSQRSQIPVCNTDSFLFALISMHFRTHFCALQDHCGANF